MTEKELKAIEADHETAKDMYSNAFGQNFPCATCIFLNTHIPTLTKAIRDRDEKIKTLREVAAKAIIEVSGADKTSIDSVMASLMGRVQELEKQRNPL